jgi:3-hydroxyacyl-CoA dehydrogenase
MKPKKTTWDEGHVAVVGAGLVGSGWAIVFARAGLDVNVRLCSWRRPARASTDR